MSPEKFGRSTQARFILDEHLNGLEVSIPFDSLPGYDVIVDNGRRLWRIQVKGVTIGTRGNYTVNIRKPGRPQPNFDWCAVWMSRENRWAFLPRYLRRRTIVRLTATGKFSGRGWEIFR